MNSFKARSNYFKTVASKNKLIGHEASVLTEDGGLRNSFFRINSEEELITACQSWIHFPCVAHMGYNLKYKKLGTGTLHKNTDTTLYFLAKKDTDAAPNEMDAIENAYDLAERAMEEFMSYIIEDFEVNGSCGNFLKIDFDGAVANMLDPINGTLYGWELVFRDENIAKRTRYDSTKFLTNP